MYTLPISIEMGGVEYNIRNKGDYRMVLDIFSILNDEELTKKERVLGALMIFYEDIEDLEDLNIFPDIDLAIKEMFNFFNAGIPDSNKNNPKLLDWDGDSGIIIPAINNVAQKEVRALEYLHWWTFMGYYMSVGESTFSTVVAIRDKVVRGKKLEKWERDYKRDNPQYFNWKSKTIEEIDDENWLKSVWNKE